MLDPNGDAHNSGRSLASSFERGVARQFANELANLLLNQYPFLNVIISKQAGETVEPLQIANFANHLKVDLFLNIGFFHERNTRPSLFIFYYKNQLFFSSSKPDPLAFYPYHQAYLFNFDKTQSWASLLQKELQKPIYKNYFTCAPALGVPYKPLVGLLAPAISFELGLKSQSYEIYLHAIAAALGELILCH